MRKKWLLVTACILLSLLLAPVLFRIWNRAIGNLPVEFYGRVIDSSGHPRGGVRIEAQVAQISPWSLRSIPPTIFPPPRTEIMNTVTDKDGAFEFHSSGQSICLTRINYLGMVLWNDGGGIMKGWSFVNRDPRAKYPDSSARRYVILMVPDNDPESKWDPDKNPQYAKRVQRAMSR